MCHINTQSMLMKKSCKTGWNTNDINENEEARTEWSDDEDDEATWCEMHKIIYERIGRYSEQGTITGKMTDKIIGIETKDW